jgi:hypothetical protein
MVEMIVPPDTALEPDAGRRSCYIEPAPVLDVMFDQLECLVAHAHGACSPGCPDCARLEQVQNVLLAPFRSVKRSSMAMAA